MPLLAHAKLPSLNRLESEGLVFTSKEEVENLSYDHEIDIGFINMISGAESNPKAYAYFNKDFGLPAAMEFAEGGVVNKPTNAIIGEAGPEAVVPLENSELVKEMKEIRKATQQLVKIIGDGKTTINLDGRVLAESTGLQMYDIAQGM